ncbi:MAG: T9SS type A sorting domain-containing protein [Bacteroidia bacterium]
MKKHITFLLVLTATLTSLAQTFNGPESVEYDTLNNRWMVGQNGSGEIHVYTPGSGLSTFATGLTSGPYGLEIMGTTLYACDGAFIRGYDLATGTNVFNKNLGATFLNGLTTDGTYLFTTDFTAKKIYRLDPASGNFNLMKTTTKTPNGIYYDGANNRCVFVTWGSSAPIQAMSLADSSVTTVLATSLSNCDGITRDLAGNWYISAWGNNSLNRTDAAFGTAPVVVKSGLSSPADLDLNEAGDSIGIPNSGTANNVVFYAISSTGIYGSQPASTAVNAYPNPSSEKVSLAFDSAVKNGSLEIYDGAGNLVSTKRVNGYAFTLERGDLEKGIYFVYLKDDLGKNITVKKIVFN